MNKSGGIQALVDGFIDGGCGFTSNYPGTHSQDIFFGLGGKRISTNEKIAFETAYGASLAGLRSVVTMKNVGLNTCADQYLHSILTGVQGGFVVVVTDDTRATGSQEREDSRHFMDFFGGLWLEPSTVEMAYEMAYDSFRLSEELDVPVTIRLTSQFFETQGVYNARPKQVRVSAGVANNPEKFIAYPIYWHRQRENLARKQEAISRYVYERYKDVRLPTGADEGAIVVGACTSELSGDVYEEYDKLFLNHYPLPEKVVGAFLEGKADVAIFEQGDPFAREKIMRSYGERAAPFDLSSNTGDCPDLKGQWTIWSHLEKLFGALEMIKPSFVVGDVGQYTVESKHVVNSCLCLGSSVGVTLGLARANVQFPFCVVGDGAFLHSNIAALREAREFGSKFGVIVIDNGGSGATGGQQLAADIHEADAGLRVEELLYDDSSLEDIKDVLVSMRQGDELSVLYVKLKKGGL